MNSAHGYSGMKLCLVLPMLLAGLSPADYQESDQWSFQGGNLVSNWSFENESTEICQGDQPGWGGTYTTCHERRDDARSGNYMLTVLAKNEGNPATQPYAISQISRALPVEPSTAYTFSVHMRIYWTERIASSAPVACWLRADKSFIGCAQGQSYVEAFPGGASDWTPYSFSFTTAPDAQYLYFHLVQSTNDGVTGGDGDYYEFDDLQIRKSSEPAGVLETRTYSNATGRVDQTIVNDGAKDMITQYEYDAQGRVSREYLPIKQTSAFSSGEFVVSAFLLGTDMTVDYLTLTDAYSDIAGRVSASAYADLPANLTVYAVVASPGQSAPAGNGPARIEVMKSSDGVAVPLTLQGVILGSDAYWALAGRHKAAVAGHWSNGPFLGDFAAAQAAQYPGESNLFKQITYPTAGVNTLGSVSSPGAQYGPANHVVKSGTALLASPAIPSQPEYNADAGNVEAPYTYSWTKDPQGKYTAEIHDERGLLIKSGVADAAVPTSEADWILSTSAYDAFGRMTSSTSPAGLATTYQYNGMGQMTQGTEPDQGMTEVLYDKLGHTRFTRSPDGRANDYMVAVQYDPMGRILGKARVTLASTYFTQAKAEDPLFPGVANLHEGALYDVLEPTLFQEATNVPLTSLGFTPPLKNTEGRQVVGFNRNMQAVPPGNWTNTNFLVATFYSYDSLGRTEEVWKYIGAAPTGRKWHKFRYTYDPEGRTLSSTAYNDQTEAQVVSRSQFTYDVLGRVTAVLDKSGQPLTMYSYDEKGRVVDVRLPGGLSVDYSYDVQGKPLSVTGSSQDKALFQEMMGYESKPHPNIVDNMAVYPRYDGSLSSLVRKYSSAAPNPVEWWRYVYDMPGRMVNSLKHLPSSGGSLATNGSINFPVTFNTAPSDEHDYAYNDDGSILDQSSATQTYAYGYTSGTHKLNAVTPNLPGRTTSAGSFVYDADGRLKNDNGTGKAFLYNFANRPVRLIVPGRTFHFLYDENDNRVATLDERSGAVLGRKIYVYESGLKVAKEIVNRDATHPDGAADVVKYHEYGRGGLVAVSYGGQNDRQVLLKDHQGNVMMVVSVSNAGVAKEQGYKPYGAMEKRVAPGTDLQVSEAYTGKEWEDASGLYYFGARFYDPELGLWLSPDAAGQFHNPYVFGGGSPVTGVDADGNWFWIDDAIATVLGAAAGYVSYGLASGDWTSGHAWTMAAIGAAAGEGALYTGGTTLTALGGASAGVGATLAAGAAGGAAGGLISGLGGYSAGAAYGDHSFTMSGAITVAIFSFGTGAISGFAGAGASQLTSGLVIGGSQIASPVARGVVSGMIGGAAGGYAGGFAGTLLTGGSLSQAYSSGLNGMFSGAAMGGIGGGIAGYANAVRNNVDPWTGARQTNSSTVGEGLIEGAHSEFKIRDGKVVHYETKIPQTNPRNPNPLETIKSFDGVGRPHFNKVTQEYIPTPHIHDPVAPGGVRTPLPEELPGGY